MQNSNILTQLNPVQKEAVTSLNQNLLILAGAGSGKTRVLAHRIAWLVHAQQVPLSAVLAVTFTNKAANEMKGRIETLVGRPLGGAWIGTFHRLAHKLLKMHHQEAELSKDFQIIDQQDQWRLVKRIMQSFNLDSKKWEPKSAQYYINAQKEEGVRADRVVVNYKNPRDVQMRKIYAAYEALCQKENLADFAELLLRSYETLKKHPNLCDHYRNRFKHILIDEFQDTNTIQYNWIKLLAGGDNHFMIIGDDDQSIYGWRGAKPENIKRFQSEFPDTRIIRLEQNYRSTDKILKAANQLIANNKDRLGKNLWTEQNQGDLITVYEAYNDFEEVQFVVDQLRYHIASGIPGSHCAILYRSNAQSRLFEEKLLQENIPYQVYGGLRFFERAEIKDALAYLRLITHREDSAALDRIINLPPRGFGDQTLDKIRLIAQENRLSLWEAANYATTHHVLTARAENALLRFVALIEELESCVNEKKVLLDEFVAEVLQKTGLVDYYKQKKTEKEQMRVENLEELVNAAKQYALNHDNAENDLLEFLAHTALSALDTASTQNDRVQLMTMHSAKGLEFSIVFMVGVEEGLFPHQSAAHDSKKLEEERRLCYVGITRAMQKLYITHANMRRFYRETVYRDVSRFIGELPDDCVDRTGMKVSVKMPRTSKSYRSRKQLKSSGSHSLKESVTSKFRIGQSVMHAAFGEGIILDLQQQSEKRIIAKIGFKGFGIKLLDLTKAKLKKI